VLGFFARELDCVSFTVPATGAGAVAPAPGRHAVDGPASLSLEELLRRTDQADGPAPDAVEEPSGDSAFAELLAQLVGDEPSADLPPLEVYGPPAPRVVEHESFDRPPAPTRSAALRSSLRAMEGAGSAARARLDMLAELRTLGVPLSITPTSGETNLLNAIEEIVATLPAATLPSAHAGEIVVLTGRRDQLDAATAALAALMHVPPGSIWTAGPGRSGEHVMSGPLDAAQRALELRTAVTASVIAVELDRSQPTDNGYSWAAQVIAAVAPTAVWAAVDCGRKTEDLRAELAHLGPIDALIVANAADTASPATVWDLDIPIALVDGRRATAGTWAGLLLDALTATGDR
jgi:hypothetical protein